MSQLIVTSHYLKNGNQKNKTKRRNYTKYIATRETVEIRSQKFVDRNANATKNQEQLINDLINDFPESKRYLEYDDYEREPTIENVRSLNVTQTSSETGRILSGIWLCVRALRREVRTACLTKRTSL